MSNTILKRHSELDNLGIEGENIKIIEHFDKVIERLKSASSRTLVAFDADNVIIRYGSLILRSSGEILRHKLYKELDEVCGKTQISGRKRAMPLSEYLRGKIIEKTIKSSIQLLDERLPNIIEDLCKRDIKSIVLTAGMTQHFAEFECMATCRVDQLKKLGIDCSYSFPDHQSLVLESLFTSENNHPVFKEGVLLTGKSSKGKALKTLLDIVNWIPDEVILIDDQKTWLDDVEEHMKKTKIKFQGFHLQHYSFTLDKINENLARFQFDYLKKNHKWLNDEEALELLKNKISLT